MRSCVADCGILIYGMFERVRFRRTFPNIPNAPKGSTPLTSTIGKPNKNGGLVRFVGVGAVGVVWELCKPTKSNEVAI